MLLSAVMMALRGTVKGKKLLLLSSPCVMLLPRPSLPEVQQDQFHHPTTLVGRIMRQVKLPQWRLVSGSRC